METFTNIVNWYAQQKSYSDFTKDVLFAVGIIATFYGYFKFLKFLTQRGALNKRLEMENDAKMYKEVQGGLKNFVDRYKDASSKNHRNIAIKLLYIKNYPYKLENDGYSQMLYYYFLSEGHQASGYISTTGLYVMEYLGHFSNAIYYNPKSEKWFIDKEGLTFRMYKQLKHKQLVKRIPFANILGYDFNSDWADYNEPVFYTKYKYYKWKLYADDFEAVTVEEEYHLANKVHIKKSRRKKRVIKTLLRRIKRKFTMLSLHWKRRKHLKILQANSKK
jgi:hypothetical protein